MSSATRFGKVFLSAVAMIALHGCASVPDRRFPDSFTSRPQVVPAIPAAATILVTYPAEVTPAALTQAQQLYSKVQLGGAAPSDLLGLYSGRNFSALDDSIARTPYFLFEYVQALRKAAPGFNVIVMPARVGLVEGQLVYLTQDVRVPVSLRVDFMVYDSSHLHIGRPWVGSTLPELTLLLEGRTLVPATRVPDGLLLKNAELPALRAYTADNAPSVLMALFAKARGTEGERHPFSTERVGPTQGLALPTTEYVITPEELSSHVGAPANARPLLSQRKMDALVGVSLQALAQVNMNTVALDSTVAYARVIDPRLDIAALPPDDARRRLVTQFAAIESDILAKASNDLLANAYAGAWGNAWRDRFRKEYESATQVNQMMWKQALAGFAFAGQAASLATLSSQLSAYAATAQGVDALTSSLKANVESLAISQSQVTTKIAEQTRTLSVKSIGELRDEFRAIYIQQFGPIR